jgi:hypothetical protein
VLNDFSGQSILSIVPGFRNQYADAGALIFLAAD